MSWATHELENYFIQRHAKTTVSFLAVALGAFGPDIFTKVFVYGVNFGAVHLGADDPILFHRGWPGAGFTHSLLFGAVVAWAILGLFRNRAWALGFLIGHWAHSITDINDTAGTMLFFPFSTETISSGMWKHAGFTGRYSDATAYYSSLGGIWDMVWLAVVLVFARRTLTKQYFREVIRAADPGPWSWLERRLRLPERALVAIYRGWLFYAGCRIVAWSLYAHVRRGAPYDLRWGGPRAIERVDLSTSSWWEAAASLSIAAVLLAMTIGLLWWCSGRRLWARAGAACVPVDGTSEPAVVAVDAVVTTSTTPVLRPAAGGGG